MRAILAAASLATLLASALAFAQGTGQIPGPEPRRIQASANPDQPTILTVPDRIEGQCSLPQQHRQFFALDIKERSVLELLFRRLQSDSPESVEGAIEIHSADGRETEYKYRLSRVDNEFHFYPVLGQGRHLVTLIQSQGRAGERFEMSLAAAELALTEQDKASARAAIPRAIAWLLQTTPAKAAGEKYPIATESLVMAALSEGEGAKDRSAVVDQEYVAWLEKDFSRNADGTWRGQPVYSCSSSTMYEHAVCALGLAEAASSGNPRARTLAGKAAQFLLAAQQSPHKPKAWGGPVEPSHWTYGGWRYYPRNVDADLSATGWCTVALFAADAANLEVPGMRDSLDAALSFIQRCNTDKGFQYTPGSSNPPADIRNSIGALLLLLYGEEAGLDVALKHLDAHLPAGTQVDVGDEYPTYYWYYATRVNYLRGGRAWERWRSTMIRQLLRRQKADDAFPTLGKDAEVNERYATALGVLILRMCLNDVPAYLRHEARGF